MIKDIARGIMPPFLFSLLKKIYETIIKGTPIFEGLYKELSQLPKNGDSPFDHPNWILYVNARAKLLKNVGMPFQNIHEMPLSLLASIIPDRITNKTFSIIDFGGGLA